MLKVLAVLQLLTLAACVQRHTDVPFDAAVQGEVSQESPVRVSGIFDTTGVGFYSLIGVNARLGTTDCIALILTEADRERAEEINGRRVIVEGHVMFVSDLERLIPTHNGDINGRAWFGTHCTEVALYVTRMAPA